MKKYAIYDPTAMVYVRVRDDLDQPFDDTSDLEEAPLYNSVECIKDI